MKIDERPPVIAPGGDGPVGSYEGNRLCDCHQEYSDCNPLVEIVVVCSSCKVIFRSRECFYAHLRKEPHCHEMYVTWRQINLDIGYLIPKYGMLFRNHEDVFRYQDSAGLSHTYECTLCNMHFVGRAYPFLRHCLNHLKDALYIQKRIPRRYRVHTIYNQPYLKPVRVVIAYHCRRCKAFFTDREREDRHRCNLENVQR